MAKPIAKPLRYSLLLIGLGLIAGFLLAYVNNITSGVLAERQRALIQEAMNEYFDYASYSVDRSDDYDNLDSDISEIYFAFGVDDQVAAVIYKTVSQGYGGDVVSLIAIKADGTFDGVHMIEGSKETPGKGDKVLTHDFQVTGEPVDSFTFEILAGSSVTSNAVVNGIEAAAEHFQTVESSLGGITND
ncbi:MAG TPA: hypothetical protein DD618_04570 [Acholeplasmatales bacterium]|nr:hypothetical protein [Acholeplasmatales bacterium]